MPLKSLQLCAFGWLRPMATLFLVVQNTGAEAELFFFFSVCSKFKLGFIQRYSRFKLSFILCVLNFSHIFIHCSKFELIFI